MLLRFFEKCAKRSCIFELALVAPLNRFEANNIFMSILREIQTALMTEGSDLSTTLLKLRFLAARLGGADLIDWVKYESEGYPDGVDVPDYRKIPVHYKGTFSGPFGSGIQNAPIPPYLIETHAGETWTRFPLRQGIASIEDVIKSGETTLHIDAANLILVMQGKVYEGYALNSVTGIISSGSMRDIWQTVRSRILELTLEIESKIPDADMVSTNVNIAENPAIKSETNTIFNQVIYGNVSYINASDGSTLTISIVAGDENSLSTSLASAGVPEDAAKEFARIVAEEKPNKSTKSLGSRSLKWIKDNSAKAGSGAWKIGSAVLTELATEAALKYYGLK